MSTCIGIDLGTTHTVAAALIDGKPTVLASAAHPALLPSVVALDDTDHVLVGEAAREVAARRPERAVQRFKSDMGSERTYTLGADEQTPVTLSALVLKEILAQAREVLGAPVERAVVTVPAWFREPQRSATMAAGRLAGLQIERLLNEPTAAALYYGLHNPEAESRAVVVDLGGGTLDVTVLELFAGMVEVAASSGDTRLGGEDFTDALEGLLRERTGTVAGDEREGLLRHRAEKAKRELSRAEVAVVPTADLPNTSLAEVRLSRADAENAWAPLLQRVDTCVRAAILQAGLRPEQVDNLLLVGGATRMPVVRALCERIVHKPALRALHPDFVVALGAAVQGGLLDRDSAVSDLVMTDVLTHSLGLEVTKHFDGRAYEGRFSPVLHRGTTLPCSREDVFSTLHHQQTQLNLRIYEGEQRLAAENTRLGELMVDNLPAHADTNARSSVRVRFTHDASGLLEVEVHRLDQQDATPQRFVLHRANQPLTGTDLDEAVASLARLKTHPRELLPNRLVMERAQRIYLQVPPDVRPHLDEAMLALESALDLQEPEVITPRREALAAYLDRLVAHFDLDAKPDEPHPGAP